jgi:hypothetical protein
VLRVYEQNARPDHVRRLDTTQEDVLKEGPSQSRALVHAINGEPREKNGRDRSRSRLALERSRDRLFRSDLGGGESVVTDDSLTVVERRHKHTCGVRSVSDAGVALEPLVERGLAAVEVVKPMLFLERPGRAIAQALFGREDVRLGEEPLEPGLVLRGTIEELDKKFPSLGVEYEPGAIGEHALGFEDRCVNDEIRQRSV